MAQKPETLFRKRLDPRLKEIPRAWFCSVQQVALIGIPDKLGCVNGFFCGLELKKDEKSKATRIQAWCLKKIRAAGGYAAVVHPGNADSVIAHLELLSQGKTTPDELQKEVSYE